MSRILIVDDEANMRRILSVMLSARGHEVTEADGVASAGVLLSERSFDVVLTDQKMQDGQGLQVIAAAKEADPLLPVIMLTAHATVELAVEAMRQGAFDFVSKPFSRDVVEAVVQRALERVGLHRENRLLREQVRQLASTDELLGESEPMRQVKAFISKVAPTNATTLITGETGTGKELAARQIHRQSLRAAAPFVAINCASLAETLLESELFGHEKGAFTGADRTRIGLFESADGGTLFLDEAAEMSLALQAKLLRVLADGQVQRVGGRGSKKVDVRLVFATHRDLASRVREGLFREDLYYRIAVVPIELPPLRRRLDDLPLLATHFLQLITREIKAPERELSAAAMVKLATYGYPGNVRELRNILERACILTHHDMIEPSDLLLGRASHAQETPPLPDQIDLREFLEQTEQQLITRAIRNANGVQAEAARQLGLSRSDLAYKIKKYGISVESPNPA